MILYSLSCLLLLIRELLLHLIECYHLLLSHIVLALEKSIVNINLWKPMSIFFSLILTKYNNLLSSIDANQYFLSNIPLLLLLSQNGLLVRILLLFFDYVLLSLSVWVILVRSSQSKCLVSFLLLKLAQLHLLISLVFIHSSLRRSLVNLGGFSSLLNPCKLFSLSWLLISDIVINKLGARSFMLKSIVERLKLGSVYLGLRSILVWVIFRPRIHQRALILKLDYIHFSL